MPPRVADGTAFTHPVGVSQYPVSPEKEEQLARRMGALGVTEADLRETFVRSGGHGGQNVNKTSTCVMIMHTPSGLQVKCQTTRQQGLNRFLARHLLLDKLEARQSGAAAERRANIEKERRQKRKPGYRAKQQMLADKARRGEKKRLRRDVRED
jgi:peptide chain release factor